MWGRRFTFYLLDTCVDGALLFMPCGGGVTVCLSFSLPLQCCQTLQPPARRGSRQRAAERPAVPSRAVRRPRLPPASAPPASRAREARWQRGRASCASRAAAAASGRRRPARSRLGLSGCSEPKRAHFFATGHTSSSIARPLDSLIHVDAVRHTTAVYFGRAQSLVERATSLVELRRLQDARRVWATSGMCGGHPWRAPEPPRQNGNSRRR